MLLGASPYQLTPHFGKEPTWKNIRSKAFRYNFLNAHFETFIQFDFFPCDFEKKQNKHNAELQQKPSPANSSNILYTR